MTSRITIEYDFDTKEPYLKVSLDNQSADMRDRMLCSLFQDVGVESVLMLHYESIHSDAPTNQSIILYPRTSDLAKKHYGSNFTLEDNGQISL